MCIERSLPRHPRSQRGLTLIELIVFIVIVGVAVAGILTVMNITVKASADPMLNKQAIAFAESILEEVLTKDYDNLHGLSATPAWDYPQPGAGICPERALADDVDDFANCNGAGSIAGNVTLGADILALGGYQARVVVATPGLNGVADMKTVTVTVTDPAGATYSLTGYKANY